MTSAFGLGPDWLESVKRDLPPRPPSTPGYFLLGGDASAPKAGRAFLGMLLSSLHADAKKKQVQCEKAPRGHNKIILVYDTGLRRAPHLKSIFF